MQSSARDMDVQPEAAPANSAQPLPQPLFRFDPGWPFVVAGLGLLVCAVLIPAQRDLQQLRNTLEVHRALEDQSLRRLEAYDRFLTDLDRNDEQLVRRLAASQLNLMPKEQRSVLLTSSVNATVTDWIDASEPLELPTPEPYPDTLLARLATGPRRLWVLACGVFLVFVGLLLGPSNPAGGRRAARGPAAGGGAIDGATASVGVATIATAETPRSEASVADGATLDANAPGAGLAESVAAATMSDELRGAALATPVESVDPDASSDEFAASMDAAAAPAMESSMAPALAAPIQCEVDSLLGDHPARTDEVAPTTLGACDAQEACGSLADAEVCDAEACDAEVSEDEVCDDGDLVAAVLEEAIVEEEVVEEAAVEDALLEEERLEEERLEVNSFQDASDAADDVESDDRGVEAHDLEMRELDVQNLEVQDLELQDLEIQDLEVQDLEIQDLEIQDLEVQAAEIRDATRECDAGDEIARAETEAIPGESECDADAAVPSANDRALDTLSLFHGLAEDRWVDTRDPRR